MSDNDYHIDLQSEENVEARAPDSAAAPPAPGNYLHSNSDKAIGRTLPTEFNVFTVSLGILYPLVTSEVVITLFYWLIGPDFSGPTNNKWMRTITRAVNDDHSPFVVLIIWSMIWPAIAFVQRHKRPSLSFGIWLGAGLGFISLLVQFIERVPLISVPGI